MTTVKDAAHAGRILFVDDDPFYRDLADDALASANFAVTVADGGASAQTELARTSFDLMVLDLSMPGVSGFDVLEHVRSNRRLADLPILVITGHDDAESVMRAFDLGATSFLAKPLNWVLFVHHVQFVLKAARTQADLRVASRSAEFMSDLKSRLVGTLVTEFQAPLRSAFGFSRLLREETDGPIESPHYKAWIGDLHRSIERLNSLHLKMLNFGRSLAESIVINEETVAVEPLVQQVLKQVRDGAARRQIALHLDCDLPPSLELRGDGMLLAQSFRGVIENSIRFSRRSTEIVVRLELAASGDLMLGIADRTPTLSAAQIDEILGLKSFATPTPETVELSTGLKLSRVLVEAHQGHMHLKSIGEGMLTELYLPRTRLLGEDQASLNVARLNGIATALQSLAKRSAAEGPVAKAPPPALRSALRTK